MELIEEACKKQSILEPGKISIRNISNKFIRQASMVTINPFGPTTVSCVSPSVSVIPSHSCT